MASESTPLVPSEHSTGSASATGGGPGAYFLGTTRTNSLKYKVQRNHPVVDSLPRGSVPPEFDPRPVAGSRGSRPPAPPTGTKNRRQMRGPSVGGGWLGYVAGAFAPSPEETTASGSGANREDRAVNAGEIGTLVLPRKAPLKLEPKVHFANERTFLAWLHLVVILAAASMTIVTYSHDEDLINQLYGIVLLPVSVAYIFYALWQYQRRSRMIKNKDPGPYIDVAGPTTLTIVLMASITTQFCVKLKAYMSEE